MIGRRTILLLVVGLLSTAGTGRAGSGADVLVRTSLAPEGGAWVGQRVSVFVTLLSRVDLDGPPRFDVPDMDTAILHQLAGSPLLGVETIDDDEYVSRRYEFLMFARKPGPVTVPPIGVRLVDVGGAKRSLSSEPRTVDVRLPSGADPRRALITSSEVDITESWTAPDDEVTVGDAIRRTISVRARNVVGIAIPPAPAPELDGLRVYRDGPTVEDTSNRGQLTGSRRDRVTYMCERPGTYVIPTLVYAWWDPETESLERRELAGREIVVRAGAAPASTDDGNGATRELGPRPRAWLLVIPAGAVLIAALLLSRRRRSRDPEAEAFRRCIDACRAGDTPAAYASWRAWSSIAPEHDHAVLREPLREVQLAIVDGRTSWNGAALASALTAARGAIRGRAAGASDALPALNPHETPNRRSGGNGLPPFFVPPTPTV